MTYTETISYLYQQLPMYQRDGSSAFKKDLGNIRKLCQHLGNPQNDLQYLHVAGTNGKGTVSHLLAAVLQSSGKKVGLYTSPHYMDFRERIKINGQLIPESYVISWVSQHKEMFQEIMPSFFEITVAMAFCYFKDQAVDIVVLETGLGGRLDSTNIVHPILSVIAQISLDHQHMLGDSVYQISKEKAGIIKAKSPVVIGLYQVECDTIFIKTAKATKAPISWASLNWSMEISSNSKAVFSNKDFIISYKYSKSESPFILENVTTALEAIKVYHQLGNISWNEKQIERGLENYRTLSNYIGRWERINDAPLTLADSAHNLDAITKVIRQLKTLNKEQIHFVLGFVKDKDVEKILSLFPKEGRFYFVRPEINRAMPLLEIEKIAGKLNLDFSSYSSVHKGISAARKEANQKDLIFIGGSSFVAGEAISRPIT